jgi:ribosomal-protein-alanine N-acetyltransferase
MQDAKGGAPTLEIVSAGPESFRVVAALYAAAFADPWPEPSVRELMAAPGTAALIAKRADGMPAGFLLGRAVADEAELLALGVIPPARRSGAGRALVAAFCRQVGPAGAAAVYLEVGADNPAALALYRGCGFEAVGRRARYYRRADRSEVDAILMKRDLTSMPG